MAKTVKTKADFKIDKMNYVRNPKIKDWGKSVTIPDESFTIRQLLNRHANGINFDNVKTPFYEEQASFTTKSIHELQKMDITDKLQYLEQHRSEMEVLENKIKAYQEEQQAQAKLNEVQTTTTTNETTTTTN